VVSVIVVIVVIVVTGVVALARGAAELIRSADGDLAHPGRAVS
jgi:hypothetical protein